MRIDRFVVLGTSTGLNVVASVALAREVGAEGHVVTVACDSGFKYLSAELYSRSLRT